jgi:hypothetical protein
VRRGGYQDKHVETLRALGASKAYLAAKDKGPDFQLGMIHEALGEHSQAALSYLRASWGATGEVRTAALTESLRVYAALLAGGDGDTDQTWTNDFLAGEIGRQLGRFDAARARFERLQTDRRAKSPPFDIIVPFELQLISDKDSAPHLIPRALP